VEASDASVLDAAFREAREETGIGRDRLELLAPSGSLLPVPADADGHYIPPCPSKGEDEHRHFDMRFVFLFDGDARDVIARAETDDIHHGAAARGAVGLGNFVALHRIHFP